jgi:hypothetical protein
MRKTILRATALVLYSSAVMAQSTDTKSPAQLDRSCSPERQHVKRQNE